MQSEWSSDKQEKYTQKIQFYEENNILKVQSRLILGQDPEDFLRPTILRDHPIVRRLIDYAHKTLHPADPVTRCLVRSHRLKPPPAGPGVTYEEMVTLLCECESVVNGRPLTYFYDDPNELRAIKPSDFI
ncbi:hypothetical protein AVEN_189798-1 [Araneus ventricosus]|uniref:Uncharacterized protein n=1 Tax=Araneus ventricosus TaxID=182803 RepID=A0A4Y2PR29_ARAVE|nr:hypothetical protein AVEN_140502-1 [Araneus ventricosus]GBN53049.1 hypothetical protein AVEN_189798-1 [Araneus ventricosus]